jgi:large subunit ribosomal protein L10
MTKEDKGVIIEELAGKFAVTPYFYITDASGMNVAKTNELRRLCFERGIEYRVIKNTLIQKALEDKILTIHLLMIQY